MPSCEKKNFHENLSQNRVRRKRAAGAGGVAPLEDRAEWTARTLRAARRFNLLRPSFAERNVEQEAASSPPFR